ncbi:hypothetical protein [Erythrobacter mangrovi]|uniref:TerB family tellurite resistance protein n=1 Tax=Erythrobacter mangrovi TaxID=2739433 RepID=A0A7D4B993_9SPHN|nr:hypothetical protein [Erythrobacter mangrovi]QKG70861.1 hypothetical protein HQR01_05455 [Erythrobacter mangrovi]
MSVHFSELAKKVGADGVITSDEVLALRREAWPDGHISQSEAEAIFALNDTILSKTTEWVDFFVEALVEYVVNQRAPKGFVDAENANWLMGQIDSDGLLCSMAELELLVRVFERAQNVPVALKDYALHQVERAVLEGVGPTRDGGALEAGNVNATEARLLRRAIFAPASERPAAVGRNEAEMLFRLKDATLGADNAPEWKQLFVQGIANYLQGYSDPDAQISRERAQELQTFMNDTSVSFGRFLGRMAKGSPNTFGVVFGRKDSGTTREAEVAAAHEVTHSEREWLDAQIEADGQVDEFELALLDFLAEE